MIESTKNVLKYSTIGLAAILVIGMSFPQAFAAQQAPVTHVTGGGDIFGKLVCPNGLEQSLDGYRVLNSILNFDATITGGQFSGTWTIGTIYQAVDGNNPVQNPTASKGGTITSGKVTGNKFVLSGVESFDNICNSTNFPIIIQIAGKCNVAPFPFNPTVKFASINGESASFRAATECS